MVDHSATVKIVGSLNMYSGGNYTSLELAAQTSHV